MDPRQRKRITVIGIIIGVLLACVVVAVAFVRQEPARSGPDSKLAGVREPRDAKAPRAVTGTRTRPKPQRCAYTYGGGPERTSDYSDVRLGRPASHLWNVRTRALIEFPPSTCDGVLYFNNAKGFTYAVRAETGDIVWKRKTGTVFDSTPAISKQRLVIGGVDGNITALDRSNGATLWKLRMDGPVESSPVVVNNERDVVAASLDGRVLSINLQQGTINWAYRTGGDIKGSPVVVNNTVYTANYAGEIVAIGLADGRLKWRKAYRLDPIRTERIYSSTPVADGKVVFGTVGGYVYALDAATGTERWKDRIGSYVYSTPAIAKGKVFVGDFAGRVHAYALNSGREQWTASMPGAISGSPVVIGDLVYVSTIKGSTSAFDVQNGRRIWTLPRGKYVPGIADNERIYLSLNGMLSAYSAARR